VGSSDVFSSETGLAVSPSLLVVKTGHIIVMGETWLCRAGQCRDDDGTWVEVLERVEVGQCWVRWRRRSKWASRQTGLGDVEKIRVEVIDARTVLERSDKEAYDRVVLGS
jgi:hypothetical protein